MTVDDDVGIIYGLDYQARSLAPVAAEADRTQFVVGTQTLKFENQVCLLEIEEDSSQLTRRSFAHNDGEIWYLATSPTRQDLLSTCHNRVVDGSAVVPGCAVYSMDINSQENGASGSLKKVAQCSFEEKVGHFSCFEWAPAGDSAVMMRDDVMCLVDGSFKGEKFQVISEHKMSPKAPQRVTVAKWNPHHNGTVVAVGVESGVQAIDTRTMGSAFAIESAHVPVTREIDFNPNRQYVLATCGDDCTIKLWDSRKTNAPLTTIARHSHWVWSVRFNPMHDQLLLTCSSDARLMLHSVVSHSSETNGLTAADQEQEDCNDESRETEQLTDGLLRSYEEHEDSVYCCAWSSGDPWVFASLSYDGRLIINRVPRKVKYQILQL